VVWLIICTVDSRPNMGLHHMKKDEATTRALMALVTELADYREHGKRIEAIIEAMAKEHGVKIPEPAVG
jgi:hypothetical protein